MKIKIISPSDGVPHEVWWADYWVKRDLEIEFVRRGYEIVSSMADLDIYLFGTFAHLDRLTAPLKFCWIYSHPYELFPDKSGQLNRFDHIFVLSKRLLSKATNSTLLFGGSSKTFVPRKDKPKYDLVFMGNAAKQARIDIIGYLIGLKRYKIGLAGTGWENVLGKRIESVDFKGSYVANAKLGEFFNQGLLSFYAGHTDMRKEGMVPVRILDIFKSSENLCIPETNVGFKDMFREIPTYESKEDLACQIDWFLTHPKERKKIALKCRVDATKWTFSKTVTEIEKWITA